MKHQLHLAAAVLLACASTAFAQEFADQRNDPASTRSFSCGNPPILNATILQGFVPTMARLSAVELRLRAGTAFPAAGFTTNARIRSGDTVLGEATAIVPGPLADRTQVLVRFDFTGVELTPGETFLIEWVTPASNILTWVGSTDDPYVAGTAFSCIGNPWPGGATDFNFTTFALPDAPPTPKDRLVALLERVHHRCLRKLLRASCLCLDRGKVRLAILKLHAFRIKAHVMACLGLLPHDEAKSLIDEARAIAAELRASRPNCRSKRRRRA